MSLPLLRHAIRTQRARLLAVCVGLAVWGFLFPVVYATFGVDLRRLVESGAFGDMFELFSRFTGGSVFTLDAALAMGIVHPITIALVAVFAIGFPVAAIAGERQRGTLEVLLARPLDRRTLLVTLVVAALAFTALALAAILGGAVAGAALFDVADELDPSALAGAWGNALFLYAAITGLGFAASVSSDRLAPALGTVLGIVVVSYALDVLARLWPDAAELGPLSLFHYFPAVDVLAGRLDLADLAVLGSVFGLGVAYALEAFPRRDLAAPS